MKQEIIFTVKPVEAKIFYNGDEYPRETMEISYSECTEDKAESFGVYVKEEVGEKWLCDCTDETTAEMVITGLKIMALLSRRGVNKKECASSLLDASAVLADNSLLLTDIAEALCTE